MDLDDFPPMLLSARTMSFDLPGWIYEIKHDGYRLTAMFGTGQSRLRLRNGTDATLWFPEVARSLAVIRGGPYIVDGEVCVFDGLGRSDFRRLEMRARRRRWYDGADSVAFAIFDLMVHAGLDITMLPLVRRKAILAELLDPHPTSVFPVAHFDADYARQFSQGVLGLDGLVAKRAFSVYTPGTRSLDWVKVERTRSRHA